MNTILSFTLVPINSGLSLSKYIAACTDIICESGLKYELHANGSNIEGSWNDVLNIVKQCQKKVHAMGVDRIFTTIQLGTRTDRNQSMDEKRQSVESKRQSNKPE
ncbi:MAG: MTH1187 family thiamine-binding protein [Candidatus Marinimicrobia bacterium]|nr:MTH1187 family thiamine-binding protein [Candidatus Neomarinimicrobiota bacterium]